MNKDLIYNRFVPEEKKDIKFGPTWCDKRKEIQLPKIKICQNFHCVTTSSPYYYTEVIIERE